MHLKVALLALLPLLAAAGCSQVGKPLDYDDCILQEMRGVTSDDAAVFIRRSCRAKFPLVEPKVETLPEDVRRQLRGRAGIRTEGRFSGTLYNGSSEWTITQVTVRLTPKGQGEGSALDEARDYNFDLMLRPLSAGDFSFMVVEPEKQYSWKIVAARGRRQNVAAN